MRRDFLRVAACGLVLFGASCFKGWDLGGPWACSDGVCPDGFSCDEGVCCRPGGSPACPTLPFENQCPDGRAPSLFFQDLDGDGEGNEKVAIRRCRPPRDARWVSSAEDCDDTRADINRAAPEECNGRDDNCDGVIDDGLPNTLFYRDEDGDGFGDPDDFVPACVAPPNYADRAGDCDDTSPARNPTAAEQCNGLDDDCNGRDDQFENRSVFVDTDAPGAGVINFPCQVPGALGVCQAGRFLCEPLAGDAGVARRCVGPARSRELCDGLDNDCNGLVDEQPGCGGPARLLNLSGAVYRAKLLPTSTSAQLTGSCQTFRPGATDETTNASGSWRAGTDIPGSRFYHVWSVEAPQGEFWDLSKLNAQLHVAFDVTQFAPYAGANGIWGEAGTGAGQSGFYPVVYLCGEFDDQYIRYRIVATGDALNQDQTTFDSMIPLNVREGSKWLVGVGSGFDTAKVRRIEVLLFSRSADFTIQFRDVTGFP